MFYYIVLFLLLAALYYNRRKKPPSGYQNSSSPGSYDPNRHRIADEIVAWSNLPQNAADQTTYLDLAERVRSGQWAANSTPAPTTDSINPPAPPPAHTPLTLSAADAFKSLDNINIMLYLGAFLIVVSAGIFIGYNFGILSGFTKVLVLAAFAIGFYGSGLGLYLKSQRLRPAGTTFTAIGLILCPLIGLATYNFIFQGTHGAAVWFLTSVFVFTLYAVSIKLIRQTYIAYLMAFVSLSMFESAINLFNVPLYYLGWGMALMSLILLLIGKRRRTWPEFDQSFQICANIFLPISILFSFLQVQNNGFNQFGIELLLAAAFYFASSFLAQRADEQKVFFGLSLGLLPAGLAIFLQPYLSTTILSYTLVGIGAYYIILGDLSAKNGRLDFRHQLLLAMGGMLPFAGFGLVAGSSLNLAITMSLALLINTFSFIRSRQTTNLLLSVIAVLSLPYLVGSNLLHLASLWQIISYLVMGVSLVLLRTHLQSPDPQTKSITTLGYVVSFSLSLGFAFTYSSWAVAALGLILAVITYWVSYVENEPNLVVASAVFSYLGILALVYSGHTTNSSIYVYALMGSGAILYLLGLQNNSLRGRLLRLSGIVGPFIGVGAQGSLDLQHAAPILSLFAAGGLSMAEAVHQKSTVAQEAAAGVLVIAFEWLLGFAGVRQEQVFTHVAAAYFAILAYRYRHAHQSETRDLLTIISLTILTLPLMIQSLAPNGQYYALFLTIESLAIIMLGMALKYKLVLFWGIAALVAEVLYQLKDVFLALPKYIISGSLGLALLAAGIYFLSRRHDV